MTDTQRITPPVAASQPTSYIDKLTDISGVAPYLSRIGGRPRSLFSAVVLEKSGHYWKDKVVVTFARDGKVSSQLEEVLPSEEEQINITAGFYLAQNSIPQYRIYPFPFPKTFNPEFSHKVPTAIHKALKEDRLFIFRDLSGKKTIMLQERVNLPDQQKIYLPWTFWEDGRWRQAEGGPGKLPLYGIEELNSYSNIHVHEGAKAARAMQRLRDGDPQTLAAHPWAEDIRHAGHLGWCSGAPSPGRTDWGPLKDVHHAVLVADNDWVGLEAIPKIARHLRKPVVYCIRFPESFPPGFDLADPWPTPSVLFGDCLQPATWATDAYPQEKAKPIHKLRDSFAQQWLTVRRPQLVAHTSLGDPMAVDEFNEQVQAFSDVTNTHRLLLNHMPAQVEGVAYRPDSEYRTLIENGRLSLNTYRPSRLQASEKSVDLWLEFLGHFIPDEEEREEVHRWIATLVSVPAIRMQYGLLLVTEAHGTGKQTFGTVLAEMVGTHNVSFPSENDLASDFNSWIAHRRLVIIPEIYSGEARQARKVYQRLKADVTDREVLVNEKHTKKYTLQNWSHYVVCSNSERALRLEDADRRWFVPTLSETPWTRFDKLYPWLEGGGYSAILGYYQREKHAPIGPGRISPVTARKKQLLRAGWTPAEEEVNRLGALLERIEKPTVISDADLKSWLWEKSQAKLDSRTIVKRMREDNSRISVQTVERWVVAGRRLRFLFLNAEAKNQWRKKGGSRELFLSWQGLISDIEVM